MELIKKRVLSEDNYKIIITNTSKYFKINDKVICFFNGINWYTILLTDMLAYPVLYFNFWSNKYNVYYKNSLVVCPITMRTMIYKGVITIVDIIDDKLYLLNNDTNDKFFMDMPYTGNKDNKTKYIKSHVKRHEVKLLTLRDIFIFIVDTKYIVVNKKYKQSCIFNKKYYENNLTYDYKDIKITYHPKTIVYIVQYYSHNTKKYKYMALVGKDINNNTVTGYNYKTTGIWPYIKKNYDFFIKKKAYIYPIFWFMVDKLYENVNIIYM